MKVVILTTQTVHHTYFVRELVREYEVDTVFVEQKLCEAPFDTHHGFEDFRDDYERESLLGGEDVVLKDVGSVVEVETVNSSESLDMLERVSPDVIVSFGVGKVNSGVIDICPNGIINLHGGNPEEYRGLDSHLWAIYHGDYKNLIVTLHRLNEELDDGEIILQQSIKPVRNMKLHQLRHFNTEICTELALSGLDMFKRNGRFVSRPQLKRGRYYSFMPSVLKDICQRRFERYTEELC